MDSSIPLKTVQTRDGLKYLNCLIKLMGWRPPPNGLKRYVYFCWSFVSFIPVLGYLPLAITISYITDLKTFSPGSFLTSLQVNLNAYGAVAKTLLVFFSLNRLQETDKVLDMMDERAKNSSEKIILSELVILLKRVFMTYFIMYFLYCFSTFLSSTVSGHPPWMIYNPFFDWRTGILNLWLHSIYEFFTMWTLVLENLISDIYAVLYAIIIRTHFDLLKTRVRNLRSDPKKTEDQNYEELVECIKDHKNILSCCKLLEPIVSRTIFAQFILIGLVLGLAMNNIFFFSSIWTGSASAFFILCIVMETFPFCYLCNMLVDDCLDLANIIAQSNWLGSEARYRRTIVIFIHHVQQPIIFLAGGFTPISLSSNISMAKFAFSIVTIVKGMNLADRFQTQ